MSEQNKPETPVFRKDTCPASCRKLRVGYKCFTCDKYSLDSAEDGQPLRRKGCRLTTM